MIPPTIIHYSPRAKARGFAANVMLVVTMALFFSAIIGPNWLFFATSGTALLWVLLVLASPETDCR